MNRFCKSTMSAVVLCALGLWTVPPESAVAETVTGDRPEIKVPRGGGRAAFEKFGCITCHMADGRGGQNEGGYGADLRVTKLSEQEVLEVISNGRAGKGMPGFKGLIDDETLQMLAVFVKEDLRMK